MDRTGETTTSPSTFAITVGTATGAAIRAGPDLGTHSAASNAGAVRTRLGTPPVVGDGQRAVRCRDGASTPSSRPEPRTP